MSVLSYSRGTGSVVGCGCSLLLDGEGAGDAICELSFLLDKNYWP